MEYHEFIEKSGWEVSREDYEQIIEPLYLKGPSDIVGIEVSLFCQWLKDNDFTLGQLRQIAAIVEAYDSAGMKYMIYDETDDRIVNESEAYGKTSEYGGSDAPCWYGDAYVARMIADRLAKGTGHRFSLRMWLQ